MMLVPVLAAAFQKGELRARADTAAARWGNKTLLFFGSALLISTTQRAPPRARGSLLFKEPT